MTVGRIVGGSKSNIISDHAVLDLNIRTFSEKTRAAIVAAIQRIVRGECGASGSPRPPDFELYDHYPVTSNDADECARAHPLSCRLRPMKRRADGQKSATRCGGAWKDHSTMGGFAVLHCRNSGAGARLSGVAGMLGE